MKCSKLEEEIKTLRMTTSLAVKAASEAEADADYARHADLLDLQQELVSLREENGALKRSLQRGGYHLAEQHPGLGSYLFDGRTSSCDNLAHHSYGDLTLHRSLVKPPKRTFQRRPTSAAGAGLYDPWNMDDDDQQRDLAAERRWVDDELHGNSGFTPLLAGTLLRQSGK